MLAKRNVVNVRRLRVLRGTKAVQALSDYITELQQPEAAELTEQQAEVMVKVAKGLIASFERERRQGALPPPVAARYRLAPVFREYEVPLAYV